MNDFAGKVVLITGASSGIGAALAKEFNQLGAKLVLCARREDRLNTLRMELQQPDVLTVPCDVRKKEDLTKAALQAREHFGKIDVVIANAGFGVAGDFEELSTEDYRNQFETNVFGLLETLRATVDDLKKSKGTAVFMGSVAGHIALPGISAYAMSKFAVRALAESLGPELAPAGVSVVLISPGFIESEFRQVDNAGVYRAEVKDPVPPWLQMRTEVAAKQIVRAVLKKRSHPIITFHGKLAVFLMRHFPGCMAALIRWKNLRGRQKL